MLNSIYFLIAMPPTPNLGDHGPLTSQRSDNRSLNSLSQNSEQTSQQSLSESLASPSPSTKKGSFFKKNFEDGMDRYLSF